MPILALFICQYLSFSYSLTRSMIQVRMRWVHSRHLSSLGGDRTAQARCVPHRYIVQLKDMCLPGLFVQTNTYDLAMPALVSRNVFRFKSEGN